MRISKGTFVVKGVADRDKLVTSAINQGFRVGYTIVRNSIDTYSITIL